jgi:hypothetical protein
LPSKRLEQRDSLLAEEVAVYVETPGFAKVAERDGYPGFLGD